MYNVDVIQAYSNRAASYTKLGAMPEALKDAEKCIELDPSFVKGYTRKGAVQFFMKEYDKALETYQEGLKLDPNNPELLDGVRRFVLVKLWAIASSPRSDNNISDVLTVLTDVLDKSIKQVVEI